MTGEVDVDGMLDRRAEAIRAAVADTRVGTPSTPVYPAAHRAVRPAGHGLLLLAAAEACAADGSGYDGWVPAAVAVEYLDAFVRVHRRAMPAVTAAPGESGGADDRLETDLLAGDLLFTRAHERLLETDATRPTQRACIRTLTTAGRRLSEAAARSRDLARDGPVDAERYARALERYGGALSAASAEIGGRLGGGSDERVDHLAAAGRHLGVAVGFAVAADAASSDRSAPGRGTAVPAFGAGVSTDEDAASILRRYAERHRSDAAARLDALPDSTGRTMLSELVSRVASADS